MLSKEENELLTRVGRGSPMGELLRRYWHPVGVTQEVTRKPQRLKILGEELVLYRGESGKPVLMQLRCAHRSLALDYGRVEGDCLRCPYHGWLYDETGQCVEQPAEPEGSGFKEKVRMRVYPTQEFSGLVFGYLGPQPAPLLPLYDLLRAEAGVKGIQVGNVGANFLNHVENIVDISHLAWLHGYSFPAYGAKKVTYRWDRKPYGLDNVMLVEGIEEPHVSCYAFPLVNRFSVPPIDPNGELVRSIIYRVPVDDELTLNYFVRFYPSAKRDFKVTHRETTPGVYRPLETDWWGIDVGDQDRMAVEQQGVVADRQNERLGVSDGGIITMRQMMRDAMAAVKEGRDPLGIIRDPALQNVDFPQKAELMAQKHRGLDYAVGFADEHREKVTTGA